MILHQFYSISMLTINFPKTHLNIVPQLERPSKWPLYKHLVSAPEVCTSCLYCQSNYMSASKFNYDSSVTNVCQANFLI